MCVNPQRKALNLCRFPSFKINGVSNQDTVKPFNVRSHLTVRDYYYPIVRFAVRNK